MKNLYVLVFTFLFFGGLLGQKNESNYDSKWFIGFNTGLTWSSSDIDNSFNIREAEAGRSTSPSGWSLFLGKSYNYDYGKLLSFDIRGRFLRGHWYGQNTQLDSSMTSNIDEVQDIYDQYNSDNGGFIPNYYTKLDRLSLELVIHLNKLREKTGLDPYIFGGIGFSWKTIMADLTSPNEFNEPNLYSEEQMLNNDLDFEYETNLIDKQKYIMPSLGFGLAYDFGNTSIGLEHKTTFTRGDQFDGYQSEVPRLENDLYHYTSAFIKFRLGGSSNRTPAPTPPSSASGFTSCPTPVVDILTTNNTSSSQGTLVINAKLTNVSTVSEIMLTDKDQMPLPFDYDANTNNVTATVSLNPGSNAFFLSATTNCGSDIQRLNIQNTTSSSSGFTSCPSPVVNILNPNNISVIQGNVTIGAQIENTNNVAEIKVVNVNQVPLPFNFDVNTNMLTATVSLVEGNNIFYVSASNNCGGDTEQINIQHSNVNCLSPVINVLNGNNASVIQGNMTISAQIANINDPSEISFTNANQVALPFNYDFNTRTMTASVVLDAGSNTFYINATNNCGGDSDQLNIEYTNTPCPSPVVNILNANNVQVNQGVLSVSAQIINVNSASEIRFTDINQTPLLFSYNVNTSVFSASVTLAEGNNTFFISASNNCGSDMDRLNIEYTNCTAPAGSFIAPAASITVDAQNILVQANVLGITDAAMVKLFVNNTQLFGYSFNPSTGLFQSNVSLEPGDNVVRIDFANDCGQGTISATVFYDQCETPFIELIHPSASGATSNNQNQNIDIQITGTDVSINNIKVKVNGKLMNLSTASFTNQLLSFSIVLAPGINTISVDVQNECGSDSEVFTIDFENCVAPSIVVNGLQTGFITTQQNLSLNITISEIFGAQNISYKLNGQNIQGLQFNTQNKTLSGSITLVPGDNYFTLSASNDCGTAIETLHVVFNECNEPTIAITSSGSLIGGTNTSVNSPAYNLTANLGNVKLAQSITVKHNGENINFSFVKGKLSSNVTLGPGLNTFNITVQTPCGEANGNLTIIFDDCQPPSITLKVPSSNIIQSTTQKAQIIAKLTNISDLSQITLLNNGVSIPFAFNNGIIKAQVLLTDGLNNIFLEAKNPCGEDTESISITFEPCQIPQIVLNPSTTPSVIMTSSVPLSALIENHAASTTVTITVNGHSIANSYYQMANGTLTGSIPLVSGMNTISIYAVSPCGSDSETLSILRCKNPSVNWINPALVNTVSTVQSFNLVAMANNALNASNIILTFNGIPQSFSYNSSNDELTATVNLVQGNNTFAIRIQNTCGATNSNITVIYNAIIEAPQTPGNNNNGSNGKTPSLNKANSSGSSNGKSNSKAVQPKSTIPKSANSSKEGTKKQTPKPQKQEPKGPSTKKKNNTNTESEKPGSSVPKTPIKKNGKGKGQ